MVNPKKKDIVAKLQERLKKTKSLVLVDYTGLSVLQQEKLRKAVKEAGGEFTVTKNTLLKLALENSQFSKLNFQIAGPTAMLFAFKDEIAPIKVLVQFSEKFELPQLKIGAFEGKLMEKEAILELAKIPARTELLAKLVYLLQSPINGFVHVLSSDTRKLVFILSNLKRKGGEN